MGRKVWLVVGLILVGMIVVHPLVFPPSVRFDCIQEALTSIKKLNYTCCSDMCNGKIVSAFMVSKEKATWMQACELCKSGPIGPNWKNKVWVVRLPSEMMPTIPDDAGTRIWGCIFAYGDPAFLDEIEIGLRRFRGF